MNPIRKIKVENIITGNRMLLKDLRVLEITGMSFGDGQVTLAYFQLATQERGSLSVPRGTPCKIIHGGWDHIDDELLELI